MALILDMATGREYRSEDAPRDNRARDPARLVMGEPCEALQQVEHLSRDLSDQLPDAVRALYRRAILERAD